MVTRPLSVQSFSAKPIKFSEVRVTNEFVKTAYLPLSESALAE